MNEGIFESRIVVRAEVLPTDNRCTRYWCIDNGAGEVQMLHWQTCPRLEALTGCCCNLWQMARHDGSLLPKLIFLPSPEWRRSSAPRQATTKPPFSLVICMHAISGLCTFRVNPHHRHEMHKRVVANLDARTRCPTRSQSQTYLCHVVHLGTVPEGLGLPLPAPCETSYLNHLSRSWTTNIQQFPRMRFPSPTPLFAKLVCVGSSTTHRSSSSP